VVIFVVYVTEFAAQFHGEGVTRVSVLLSLIFIEKFYKMALGGCYQCLKYLMFVFNFIFWVTDVIYVQLGLTACESHHHHHYHHHMLNQEVTSGIIINLL